MSAETVRAAQIVQAVMDDLMSRSGIDDMLGSIEFDVFNAMCDDLIAIVESHL